MGIYTLRFTGLFNLQILVHCVVKNLSFTNKLSQFSSSGYVFIKPYFPGRRKLKEIISSRRKAKIHLCGAAADTRPFDSYPLLTVSGRL
jgi:hypothetical protein